VLGRFVFGAALLVAWPVWAQEADSPPTREAITAAKAHAEAVLDRMEARPFFVNATVDDTATVRHVASGMTCEFTGGDDRDTIRFYGPVQNGPVRGDDVSCGTWVGRTYVTLFATRYPQRFSQDQLFEDARRQLVGNWPSAKAHEGPMDILTLQGQADPLAAAFNVELEGRPSRSLILVRNIGEWSFKARATGPGTDDTVAEFGSMAFARALPNEPPAQ
jgi:hypothetical protein